MVLRQLHSLRICKTSGTCFLDNGLFNQGLFGINHRNYAYKSCFNAFSRVDMRVEVRIPGGVKTHVIDERGNKFVTESKRLT